MCDSSMMPKTINTPVAEIFERVIQLEKRVEDLERFRESAEDVSVQTNDRLSAIENGFSIDMNLESLSYHAGYDDGVKDTLKRNGKKR